MGDEAPAVESAGDGAAPATRNRSARLDPRGLLILVVVVGWLAVQLIVPVARLLERGGGARPRTFGWQMFSHQLQGPAETFTITTANGTREIPIDDLLTGPMRREILYAPRVVEELCKNPAIISVVVTDAEWGSSTVVCP